MRLYRRSERRKKRRTDRHVDHHAYDVVGDGDKRSGGKCGVDLEPLERKRDKCAEY